MRVNLDTLGLRGGERHVSDYPIEVAPIVAGGVEFSAVVPGGATLTVERIAGGFMVDIAFDAKVCGPCSRCLKEFCVEVSAAEQEFVPAVPEGWTESEAEISPFIEDLVVDVEGLCREALVLAMPDRMICSDDCKGLCPVCGTDLNFEKCSCTALEV